MTHRKKSKWLTVAFPLALFCGATSVIVFFTVRAVGERRFEIQSRQTLLEIQRALQDYHVAEEIYPRRTPMTGAQVVQLLLDSGHLESAPLNPWTRERYRIEDPGQPDGLTYRTDELAETYALESKGPDPTADAIAWQLDSTEHQSLE